MLSTMTHLLVSARGTRERRSLRVEQSHRGTGLRVLELGASDFLAMFIIQALATSLSARKRSSRYAFVAPPFRLAPASPRTRRRARHTPAHCSRGARAGREDYLSRFRRLLLSSRSVRPADTTVRSLKYRPWLPCLRIAISLVVSMWSTRAGPSYTLAHWIVQLAR